MERRELLKHLGLVVGGTFCAGPLWAQADAGKESNKDGGKLAMPLRALVRKKGALSQVIVIRASHVGSPTEITTRVDGEVVDRRRVEAGTTEFEVHVRPVSTVSQATVSVEMDGATQTERVTLRPVRHVLTYILPHSHHDLGYTDLQANVEEKQMRNITRGMQLAQQTASYPEGSRFVWNLEVLWGADLFMRQRSAQEQAELLEAIRKGSIALNGSYANELTGLCRPEELLNLFRYGTQLGKQAGVKVDSAMMSDVPGFSWGTVTAMSQAGIRYFSAAPNFFDRIGTFMVAWQDKPVWWVSPSGNEKVLFWVPWTGYAMSHVMKIGPEWVNRYQERLDEVAYPYEISHIRWSGHGDNAEPDPEISEFARAWNDKYEWPKFAIASTSTAFAAMEQRYGDQLPKVRGDLTPYWEDGAGSSALETKMSRTSADRLTQAAALAAMVAPTALSGPAYDEIWRDVLMYSEHTWGAFNSVSDSEIDFVKKQWAFKRAFAVDAEQRSEQLVSSILEQNASTISSSIEVYNCTSWNRTEIVYLSRELSAAGDHVADQHGRAVSSQRLSTGELAVQVTDVPAFGSARYAISAKQPHHHGAKAQFHAGVLENGILRATLNPQTGDITELTMHGSARNLVDRNKGSLNQFLFLAGDDVDHLGQSGVASIVVEDSGPLVVSVRIESSAPGCNRLMRHVRMVAGEDHFELSNLVDKKQAALNPHPGKGNQGSEFAQHGSKESIQFAFPFSVPRAKTMMDIPLAVMQPEIDQLPGSNKNWLPIGRWVDISNEDHGVTWTTLDAPLIELGGITATMLGSQTKPDIWRKHIEPTQAVYSWVMNNHWGTNYRAYQEGPVTFRYAIRPHGGSDLAEAGRFAIGKSQPLLISQASNAKQSADSLVRVDPPDVLAIALKPSEDEKAWIVRLFGASGKAHDARLIWRDNKVGRTWLSNLAEEQLSPVDGSVPVAGWDLVTLRVEQK